MIRISSTARHIAASSGAHRSMRSSKLSYVLVVCCALYMLFLVYIVRAVQPLQGIMAEGKVDPYRVAWGLAFCEVGFAAIWAWRDQTLRPGALFIGFQLIFVLAPSAAYASCYPELSLLWVGAFAVLLWVVRAFVHLLSQRIQATGIPWQKVGIVLVGIWSLYGLFVLVAAIYRGKYSLDILGDIESLYDFRKEVYQSSKSRELSSLSCIGYFVLPYLYFKWAYSRQHYRMLAAAPLVLALYIVTGVKTYIAIIGISCVTAWLVKRATAAKAMIWYLGLLIAAIMPYFAYSVSTEDIWPMALLHRALMTPGELNSIYLQHFDSSVHVPIYVLFPKEMGNRAGLSWAEDVQYSVFGGDVGQGQGANVGIFASAYSIFGLPGLVMYTALLALCLAYLDKRWESDSAHLRVFASVPALFLLTNIDFTTVFLYFGLGFGIVYASNDAWLDRFDSWLGISRRFRVAVRRKVGCEVRGA